MKLICLILLGALYYCIVFFLLRILPDKLTRIVSLVICFVVFLFVMYLGFYWIYKLGQFWNMEAQNKIILGIACILVFITSFIYDRRKK